MWYNIIYLPRKWPVIMGMEIFLGIASPYNTIEFSGISSNHSNKLPLVHSSRYLLLLHTKEIYWSIIITLENLLVVHLIISDCSTLFYIDPSPFLCKLLKRFIDIHTGINSIVCEKLTTLFMIFYNL